jgi:hypothetical protein
MNFFADFPTRVQQAVTINDIYSDDRRPFAVSVFSLVRETWSMEYRDWGNTEHRG